MCETPASGTQHAARLGGCGHLACSLLTPRLLSWPGAAPAAVPCCVDAARPRGELSEAGWELGRCRLRRSLTVQGRSEPALG